MTSIYQIYPDWATGIVYAKGQIVRGSNGALFKAKDHHKSAAGTKPITGGTYSTWWGATTPSVPRSRKPDGTIKMQDMVSDSGTRSSAPSYESVMRTNPYRH